MRKVTYRNQGPDNKDLRQVIFRVTEDLKSLIFQNKYVADTTLCNIADNIIYTFLHLFLSNGGMHLYYF